MNYKKHITFSKKVQARAKTTKGFTLFVALIVTSLLLAIGFSLSNIILKQLIFSQSSRESQIAFYAADSAAECALYWDRKGENGTTTAYGAFATSTEYEASIGGRYEIYCGDGTDSTGRVGSFVKVLENDGVDPVNAATTTFSIDFADTVSGLEVGGQKGTCAKVQVAKWVDNSSGQPVERTTVDARGYNTPFSGPVGIGLINGGAGDGTCNITSNRVVERAVRIDY